jgi:EmrB/QacA subfamily drug resistance transporter
MQAPGAAHGGGVEPGGVLTANAPAFEPPSAVPPVAAPPTRPVTARATRVPAGEAPRAGAWPTHWVLPVAVVVVGMFLSVLDSSILNVAVPAIGKEFVASTEDTQWLGTTYRLAQAVVVPATAWLAQRLGLRRMYLLALFLFAVLSAVCSTAWSLDSLIAFRVLQAIPGSMTPVVCLAILFRLVPKPKLGLAMSMYGLGIVTAPGVAPLVGGYLVENDRWRFVFYLDAPLALLGAIAAALVLPRFPARRDRRFDLLGFGCVTLGLCALLLALSKAVDWGWTSYRVLILIAVGVDALALFVVVELQVAHPLLDLRVFTRRPFVAMLVLIDILFTGVFAVLFYLPLFLGQGQRLTPTTIGLLLLPQALVWMVMMPVAGRIYARVGPRRPALVGLVLVGGGTLLLTRISVDLAVPELVGWLCLRAVGLGLALVPILAGGMSALPPELINEGSALRTLAQRLTATLGLALLTALASGQQAQLMADRAGLLRAVGADADPRIVELRRLGPGGLIALWQQLRISVQAQTYANVFLIVGGFTLVGALLAALLPSATAGRRRGPAGR